jgi:indole-3-glycerol phosphate synthase
MSNILDSIIARKKEEVKNLRHPSNVKKSERNFVTAMRSVHPSLLAEVKPRSPSEGTIISSARIPNIVSVYNQQAQAISVLCDEEFFGGGYDLLTEVRAMTKLPILAKEFIIDPVQIRKAREAGADAVLLIAAVLEEGQIAELSQVAIDLGMAILFEVHHGEEMGKIPTLPSESLVIGINNRNLSTLEIDLEMTPALSLNIRTGFPDHLLISESGIESRKDIERLQNDCDGFLIGTTFLKASDPSEKLLELFS